MDLKNLMSTWKEYQKWLKDQGINSSNIQEKLPEFIDNLKQDPEKLQQLKGILNDKSLLPYTGGTFKMLGSPCCSPSNNLRSINGTTPTAAPALASVEEVVPSVSNTKSVESKNGK